MNREQLVRILDSALRAPTGDNCQPWRFVWRSDELSILHDPNRAAHPLDREHHASLLALGCLVEGISLAAGEEGLGIEIADHEPAAGPIWAKVRFRKSEDGRDPLAALVASRCTDRRLYRGGRTDHPVIVDIVRDGARCRLAKLAVAPPAADDFLAYVARAECALARQPSILSATLGWVRFTRRAAERTRDGMHWRNLGLGLIESRLIGMLRHPSVHRLLGRIGLEPKVRRLVKSQLKSSAGVLGIAVREPGPASLVEAGRLAYRAWLRLNGAGLAVQPLTLASLSVYDAHRGALTADTPPALANVFLSGRDTLARHFGWTKSDLPVWMFRYGEAAALPGRLRTLRRKAADLLTVE